MIRTWCKDHPIQFMACYLVFYLTFFKLLEQGIQVPDEIVAQYRPDMSRAEAEDVAVRISLSIMEKLEELADGFYFMTPFNRVSLITRIIHARKPQ